MKKILLSLCFLASITLVSCSDIYAQATLAPDGEIRYECGYIYNDWPTILEGGVFYYNAGYGWKLVPRGYYSEVVQLFFPRTIYSHHRVPQPIHRNPSSTWRHHEPGRHPQGGYNHRPNQGPRNHGNFNHGIGQHPNGHMGQGQNHNHGNHMGGQQHGKR